MFKPSHTDFAQRAPRPWIRLLVGCSVALWNFHAKAAPVKDRFFETSDGVRLHYVEAGKGPETLVFVPGWLMPAAVFEAQVSELSERYRVVAFDPRSQGKSAVFNGSHTPERRSQDLHELLQAVRPEKPILAGWSLGVMEVLDYLARYKPEKIAGLVLIDNSIGEGHPPAASKTAHSPKAASPQTASNENAEGRSEYLKRFTLSLTKKPLPPEMFHSIYSSATQVPAEAARELIQKPYPREYWRDTLLSQTVPILYAIRPRFEEQGRLLAAKRPSQAVVEVFPEAGHALFIDEPARFNRIVSSFAEKVWSAQRPGH